MIFLINFILAIKIVQIAASNKCTPKIENPDPSQASCYDSYGCLWDLSQCSPCLNEECKCQSYGTCDTCVDGKFFNPETETCDNCPMNCNKCCLRRSLTKYICYECKTGFSLIGGVCKSIVGCTKLLENSDKCIECADGYFLNENLICELCDKACTKCKTKLDCIESSNGLCVKCCPDTGAKCADANCVVSIPDPIKQDCEDDKKNDVIPNCDQYYFDFHEVKCKCKQCQIGHYLQRIPGKTPYEKCNSCDRRADDSDTDFQRCRIDNDQNLIAVECKGEYIVDLFSGECVINKKSCRRMFGDSCSDCYDNFYPELIENTTPRKYQCYENKVLGCKIPKEKGMLCYECEDGYYLENDGCFTCNINCTKPSCKICNKCTNSTNCTECKDGYRIKEGKCSKCSNPNCKSCESLEKVCTSCIDGYGLNPQAKGDDDQCIQCQDNCLKCDVDFRKCTECYNDYFILNYVCKRKPQNCVLHQNGYCIQCEYGYTAEGGYCLLCANDDLGVYTCPKNCTDIEISLVQLLYQSILKPSFILLMSMIIFSYVF